MNINHRSFDIIAGFIAKNDSRLLRVGPFRLANASYGRAGTSCEQQFVRYEAQHLARLRYRCQNQRLEQGNADRVVSQQSPNEKLEPTHRLYGK
jgi:hypothetical protein